MTRDQLLLIMPHAKGRIDRFLQPLLAAMAEFGIDTPRRQAAFVAQIAHESGQLRCVEENLNYGVNALMRTWPKRFPNAIVASEYANQPERIANLVYANRMGNGAPETGDGWRHRGAGLIQLTGRDNQQVCADYFGIPLYQIGAWLRTPEGACRSAAWFWKRNGLNTLADAGDFLGVTKRINGGTIGLEDRTAFFDKAQAVLA